MDGDEAAQISDAELDSEGDDDVESELSHWLQQLNIAQQDTGDEVKKRKPPVPVKPTRASIAAKRAMDTSSPPPPPPASLASKPTQSHDPLADVDLDSILNELSALESQLTSQQTQIDSSLNRIQVAPPSNVGEKQSPAKKEPLPKPKAEPKAEVKSSKTYDLSSDLDDQLLSALSELSEIAGGMTVTNGISSSSSWRQEADLEADSAFSDNASLPSSGSHTSVTTNSSRNSASSSGLGVPPSSPLPAVEQTTTTTTTTASTKDDKGKLTKTNDTAAEQKKVVVKVHTSDGGCRTVLVSDDMSVAQVCDILVAKGRLQPSPHWTLVDQMPDIFMERILEDHECLAENLSMRTRDSTNRLLFLLKPEKFDVFFEPERYLLPECDNSMDYSDAEREALIKEYIGSSEPRVPNMEGVLQLKCEGRKVWKKHYVVLRASGVYFNPKGKAKSTKDLACLQKLDFAEVYTAIGWRKKYKAPTEFGFALKHAKIQKKAPKCIRYVCVDDQPTLDLWVTAIRIVKFGEQLLHNYDSATENVVCWNPEAILRSTEPPATPSGKTDVERSSSVRVISRSSLRSTSSDKTDSVCRAHMEALEFRSQTPAAERNKQSVCRTPSVDSANVCRTPAHLAALQLTTNESAETERCRMQAMPSSPTAQQAASILKLQRSSSSAQSLQRQSAGVPPPTPPKPRVVAKPAGPLTMPKPAVTPMKPPLTMPKPAAPPTMPKPPTPGRTSPQPPMNGARPKVATPSTPKRNGSTKLSCNADNSVAPTASFVADLQRALAAKPMPANGPASPPLPPQPAAFTYSRLSNSDLPPPPPAEMLVVGGSTPQKKKLPPPPPPKRSVATVLSGAK